MYIIRREFTMEELIAVLNQFGLKKAWPSIKEILDL